MPEMNGKELKAREVLDQQESGIMWQTQPPGRIYKTVRKVLDEERG
jgi:hypothetical protein